VLADDYSSIYEYLQSPVTFYVEDFRDKKNGAILHHAWSAKSNEEFKVLFQKLVKAHKPIGIKNITMGKFILPFRYYRFIKSNMHRSGAKMPA
jgi:hypothetical protein